MITMSAGHFGKGTGANGFIDEGIEAIAIVEALAKLFSASNIQAHFIVDRQSENQQQNLRYLISAHNATARELDVSIHFNAVKETREQGIGTEVLYVNHKLQSFAEQLSSAIAGAGGLINRGAKHNEQLAFLNGTNKPALLIEICFVNSRVDTTLYEQNKSAIIQAIFTTLQNYFSKNPAPFSSVALAQKVQKLFQDREEIQRQLEQGVQKGLYQQVWLDKFHQQKLTLEDYLALTCIQFRKNF